MSTRIANLRPCPAAHCLASALLLVVTVTSGPVSAQAPAADTPEPPPGFRALFNGRNLEGWWGMPTQHPDFWLTLDGEKYAAQRRASMKEILPFWEVDLGELINDGDGYYLTTVEFFGDFELRASVKLQGGADTGIYLRGMPQVQIWDPSLDRRDAALGSGGLWNNPPGAAGRRPLERADRPIGEWNDLRIVMIGERVSVWLNETLVTDHARLVNYFDRDEPIPPRGPIQLQAEGGRTRWRDVFIRELSALEANAFLEERANHGFESILGRDELTGWAGATDDYQLAYGELTCKPGRGGVIYTEREYADFAVRLQFRLPPGGNNGLAIRYPGDGNAAYGGMCELQVLDNTAEKYESLDPRQYHGSVYGQVAAARGYLRPVGQWNFQEVTVIGPRITVELNGTRILDADLTEVNDFMYPASRFAGRDRRSGHFGFCGHNDPVRFRRVRVKVLEVGGSS